MQISVSEAAPGNGAVAITPGILETRSVRALARHLPTVGRIAMGILFFLIGANGFLDFLPRPSTPMPEGAAAFAGALAQTGYLFPLVMATQLAVGVLLLSNRFVPLALTLIAPLVVNIFLFHAVLAPSGIGLAVVIGVLEISLVRAHRAAFRPMLAAISRPRSSS